MEPIWQWGLTSVIAIVTFLGGRLFEQYRIANQNRLKLLEPVEMWVDKASRLVGIIGDDLAAITQGLPFPVGYSFQERLETSRSMGENKGKVFGILSSKALSTKGTRSLSSKLKDGLTKLDILIEREYLQIHAKMMDKLTAHQDASQEILSLIQISVLANVLIQDIHGSLAELKTKFN
jgi:hypothetical protein